MRSSIRHLYRRAIFLVDYLVAKIPPRNFSNHSVAIVRVDLIGDFILWLPAAEKLRTIFPGSKLTLVANDAWADLARDLPYWDEVIAINMKWFSFEKLLYRWRTLRLIASKGFQIAIQPVYSRSLADGDSIIRATNAVERIGFVGDFSNLLKEEADVTNRWYTNLHPTVVEAIHEIDRNLEIMGQISGVKYKRTLPQLELAGEVKSNLIESLDNYLVITPGASWEGKRWGVSNYVELIQCILERIDLGVVLCGSQAEFDLCESVRKQDPRIINLAGKTTLRELVSILKGAILVIGNDSSAIHIANSVGTRSICILGGGHFGRFLPYPEDSSDIKPITLFKKMDCYQCNWRCTKAQIFTDGAPCIQGMGVDEVKSEIEHLLGNNLSH
ncbi:glycosyltransferase family 9 protein [Polynucleobacter ibericus]|uniref:glycosyltransferase family 9 protein n=1 Tax=Polynucleobacter ibericus TaxID=1819725 RepID=UPI001BFE85E8|nr:glycosyltransferase family 9 protein [Polynucleobacter ibericus]QWE08947.1 glycosyltransferase family 9 protein [Polynucleobacter ibericus]